MKFKNLPIQVKLICGIGLPICLLVGSGSQSFNKLGFVKDTHHWVTHTSPFKVIK